MLVPILATGERNPNTTQLDRVIADYGVLPTFNCSTAVQCDTPQILPVGNTWSGFFSTRKVMFGYALKGRYLVVIDRGQNKPLYFKRSESGVYYATNNPDPDTRLMVQMMRANDKMVTGQADTERDINTFHETMVAPRLDAMTSSIKSNFITTATWALIFPLTLAVILFVLQNGIKSDVTGVKTDVGKVAELLNAASANLKAVDATNKRQDEEIKGATLRINVNEEKIDEMGERVYIQGEAINTLQRKIQSIVTTGFLNQIMDHAHVQDQWEIDSEPFNPPPPKTTVRVIKPTAAKKKHEVAVIPPKKIEEELEPFIGEKVQDVVVKKEATTTTISWFDVFTYMVIGFISVLVICTIVHQCALAMSA